LPFGEEIPANTAGRNGQWGPGNDNVNQKFTGQFRDSETGIDYFNARYYGAALGRFTSADPDNVGADPSDPQTWNGYSYVRNNPLVLTDPSGECFFCDLFGFLLAPETGGASLALTAIGAAVDTAVLIGETLSGGGSHGKGGSNTVPSANPPVSSAPFPPGSFPGGENLGLPPGTSVPLPGPGVVLGLGDACEFGVCGGTSVFQTGGATALGTACAENPVCATVAGALGLGAYLVYKTTPIGPVQVPSDFHYSGPQIVLQRPTITLMGKVQSNEWTDWARAQVQAGKYSDPCSALEAAAAAATDTVTKLKIKQAQKFLGCANQRKQRR
jgi:RHS repeat-associated protein